MREKSSGTCILYLVLNMRSIVTIVILSFLVGCSGSDDTPPVLEQPPFKQLTDSISKSPGSADLYYRRGVLLYRNEQQQLAEHDIRKAWNLQANEEFALSMATILRRKNADSAILFLENATKRLPSSISLQVALARGYQSKGEKDKAGQLTDAILKQYPGQLDALTLKSELVGEKDRKAALAYLEQAHALVPSDPQLAYDLAYEYADTKHPRALHLLDSLIRVGAPEFEKAHFCKGIYFERSGEPELAVKSYDMAIRTNINYGDPYLGKGQLLYELKKYAEAQKNFEVALKISPAVGEFYFWLAKTQEAQGKKQEAKANYERAYGLDKSMTEAKAAADKL
jgi:tetratricopeptide (TPR) repeat protein